jgi:hypothetical protein
MKGDFSTFRYDPRRNDQGVLFQQGRVTLDADLTDAELIALHWREQAARDVIGSGVAAVPVKDSAGFHVDAARVVGNDVILTLDPGRAWADGILLYLPGDPANPTAPVERTANYFPAPINPAGTSTTSITDKIRDAVVLEVVLEELNAFQEPDRLIEPALGGPDTAERITPRFRLGLVRLGDNEDCTSIAGRIADPPAGLGRLTVTLEPPQLIVDQDCPTVAGGGYTGFEHNLYRIEIADTTAGAPRFKWSQFNGSLVGRGLFLAGAPKTVTITANRAAIVSCGLTDFYLEALAYDTARGAWSVVYATAATLNSDSDLELADPPTFGTFAFGTDSVFFRLWNGIENIGDYDDATPTSWRDGIQLQFEPTATASYRAGDYWTFPVRAGEIVNPDVLVDDAPPMGPRYHRVPIAEIDWTAARDTAEGGMIEDCRRRFRPLTNQRVCCSILVGDGVSSFGDFDSLEEAAEHLPSSGGELCLLPGVHYANLVLENRFDIKVKGCPHRSLVLPHPDRADQPVIGVMDCAGIELNGLDIVSFFGPAVVADGTDAGDLKDFAVYDCRILARTYAVRVNHGEGVDIARNRLQLIDTADGRAAVQIRAAGARIERNFVGVFPRELAPGGNDTPPANGGTSVVPTDPCADPNTSYVGAGNIQYLVMYAQLAWVMMVALFPEQPYRAWGGIHVLGGAERIDISENTIDGGAGHGVTLGGVLAADVVVEDTTDTTNAPPAPSVTLVSERFTAHVLDGTRKPLGAIDVYLTNAAGVAFHGQSDANGLVDIPAQVGTYAVTLVPGYSVVSISVVETGAARTFVIIVRQVAVEFSEDQAFLYQITVQRNDIARMALSGVGFRRFDDTPSPVTPPDLSDPNAAATLLASLFAPRELIGTCNVIRDLIIRGNRIHDNLRAVFTDQLLRDARTVGQGGISLGLVENALIVENEVLDNGQSAVDPTCGVFVGYGENIEVRDNRIAGNGPVVDENYETEKVEGLRGGVFVRLASSLLVGGEADAQQKPALRITGNYIDQPAGRAITAFAFGPVACVGNYLNSERTGRWAIYDTLVGGVMILNVGGIQRQTRVGDTNSFTSNLTGGLNQATSNVAGAAGAQATTSAGMATNANASLAVGTAQAAELLLPGGEVLYNSNQLRIGTNHRSALATLVVTLDDLGFDGNQSTVLRPDILVSNALCLAFSLRATDNRFRERTRQAPFSLVTLGYGLSAAGRLITMNTTANNQGDHCIIALSNGTSVGGLPVIDDNNLEVTRSLCARLKESPATANAAILAALVSVLVSQSGGNVDVSSVNMTVQQATVNATGSVVGVASQYRYTQSVETARLSKELGSDDPRVVKMQSQMQRADAGLMQLNVETQIAAVTEVAVPQGGSVVDGRITDTNALGRPNLTVELSKRDGTPLGVTAKTDASGYYTMPLDANTAKQVASGAVYVQVKDEEGSVLHRTDAAIKLTTDTTVHAPIVLATKPVSQADLVRGTVVFREAAPGGTVDDTPVTTSTPLENIKGIGPKTADRLRAAGIADVEAYVRTPAQKLVDIAGFDARVLHREAEKVLAKATGKAPAAATSAKRAATTATKAARKKGKTK